MVNDSDADLLAEEAFCARPTVATFGIASTVGFGQSDELVEKEQQQQHVSPERLMSQSDTSSFGEFRPVSSPKVDV
ncbi:unnamed protein product [Nippostrongylus brasiliensis]|uniref:Uncharacterized protein n=1 Tax=Nippostrongylus brasiliensis TaxID=27835 RepID=A0A0N4XGH6_NIPBR|nr:unnamed protein product [Nippostrongylus brasiliensis]